MKKKPYRSATKLTTSERPNGNLHAERNASLVTRHREMCRIAARKPSIAIFKDFLSIAPN